MPEASGWKKCLRCNGYGTREMFKKKKKIRKSKDSMFGSCIGSMFDGTAQHRKYENYVTKQEQRKGISNDPYYINPYSQVDVKYIKCNLCNGIGWIKEPEYDDKELIDKK